LKLHRCNFLFESGLDGFAALECEGYVKPSMEPTRLSAKPAYVSRVQGIQDHHESNPPKETRIDHANVLFLERAPAEETLQKVVGAENFPGR